MFTKQHYKAIADIIIECDGGHHDWLIDPVMLMNRFADFFQKDNPRFDRDRWSDYLKANS